MANPIDTNWAPRADTVYSTEDIHTKGGLQVVADLSARNAIPAARRKAGMLVVLTSDKSVWQLQDDLTTWNSFGGGGGGGIGAVVRWPSGQSLSAVVSQIPAVGAGAAIVQLVDDGAQIPWNFDVAGRDFSNVKWIGMARADYLGGATNGLAYVNFTQRPTGGVFNGENLALANGGVVLSDGTNNLSLHLKNCILFNFGSGVVIDLTTSGNHAVFDFDNTELQGSDASHTAMLLHGSNNYGAGPPNMVFHDQSFLAPYAIGHTGGGTAALTAAVDATVSIDSLAIGAGITLTQTKVGSAARLPYSPAVPGNYTPSVADVAAALDQIVGNVAAPSNPQVYVNASTGNDANDGSSGNPVLTLAKAISLLPPRYKGKCRINIQVAGNYNVAQSAILQFGYGISGAEPILIQGPAMTSVLGPRNVTGLPTPNSITIDGAALTAGQWRGYFVQGNVGGQPAIAQVLDNTGNTLIFTSPVDFDSTISIVQPSARIGLNDPGTNPTTWQGVGKGVTRLEMVNVWVNTVSAGGTIFDWTLRNLTLNMWNSWVGVDAAHAANAGILSIENAEMYAGFSGLIQDLVTLSNESQTPSSPTQNGQIGAGLTVLNTTVGIDSASSARQTPSGAPGLWYFNGTALGAISIGVDGAHWAFGWVYSKDAFFSIGNGAFVTAGGGAQNSEGACDGPAGFSCWQVFGGAKLVLDTIDISNTINAVDVQDDATVILGTAGNGNAPSGTGNSGVGVSCTKLGKAVLEATTTVPGAPLLTGALGDTSVDGAVLPWFPGVTSQVLLSGVRMPLWPDEAGIIKDTPSLLTFGVGNQTDGTIISPLRRGMQIVGLQTYKPAGPPGIQIKFALWDTLATTQLATVTTPALSAGAQIVTVMFANPIALLAGKPYSISKHETTGFAKWYAAGPPVGGINGAFGDPGWQRVSGCFFAGDAFPATADTNNMYVVTPIFA